MEKGTINDLFETAIGAEREARQLYLKLTDMFSGHDKAREFFSSMAEDEKEHESALVTLRDSLPAGELQREAPAFSLIIATRFLNFSATNSTSEIRTLEDAYRAVVNFEFSEANKLKELLHELHINSEEQKDELSSRLRCHLDKVSEFRHSVPDMHYRP